MLFFFLVLYIDTQFFTEKKVQQTIAGLTGQNTRKAGFITKKQNPTIELRQGVGIYLHLNWRAQCLYNYVKKAKALATWETAMQHSQ